MYRVDGERRVTSGGRTIATDRTAAVAALPWGPGQSYLVTAPGRPIGDVHRAGQREVQAHEQDTDPLWVPPDEIPSHTAVAALYKAMAGLCRKGESTALAVLVAAYSGVRLGELRALRAYPVGMGLFPTMCYTLGGHVRYHEVGLTDAIL